jgi:hypothetical protein
MRKPYGSIRAQASNLSLWYFGTYIAGAAKLACRLAATALFLIPMLIAAACCAQEVNPVKPVCNAQTQSKLWPEKTSRGNSVPIEICVAGFLKYQWKQLTVDVSQLKAARKKVIAGKASNAATPAR